MVRIGLLTFHHAYNFGANLHVLALQRAMEARGVTATVIDYRDPLRESAYSSVTSRAQAETHEQFISKHLNLSPRFRDSDTLWEYCLDAFDAVVISMDVLRLNTLEPRRMIKHLISSNIRWTPSARGGLPPYWLPWPSTSADRKVAKLGLAVSAVGTKFYLLDPRLYMPISESLQDFERLTVRDEWTKLMVRCLSFGRVVPPICPDPVFFLPKYLSRTEMLPESDVSNLVLLSGSFSKEWITALADHLSGMGFGIGSLSSPERNLEIEGADASLELPMSPLTWFGLLRSARGFIGSRFHAMVSCMANDTPFITIDPGRRFDLWQYRRSSKYLDLCRSAGTESRYLLQRELSSTAPEVVIDRLFDEASFERAIRYRSEAEETVERELDLLLERAVAHQK